MNNILFFALLGLAILSATLYIIWQDEQKPWCSLCLKSLSSLLFSILAIVSIFLNRDFSNFSLFD